MNDRREYCCCNAAGHSAKRLAAKLYDMTDAWYAEHGIAVGCDAKAIKHHQRDCETAIRAAYMANQAEIEQSCGFFEPLTVISIILTIIRLFYDWTHQRTS